MIFRVPLQSRDCASLALVRGMDVDSRGLDARMPKNILDCESICPGFSEPGPCCMAKVVKAKVFDSGIFEGGVESLFRLHNWVTRFPMAFKNEFSLFSFLQLCQSLSDGFIHRNVPVFPTFGLGDNDLIACEINLPPFQI